ncbi:tyrosine-protein kinase receptor Tie-1-like [Branchiostoma floridae x Branchiostoma belcheri]
MTSPACTTSNAVMDVTLVIDPFIEEYNDRTYLKCVTGEEAYDINFGPVLESQQEQFYGLSSDQVVVGDVWPEGYRGAMYWFRQSAGGARVGAFFCDVTGRGGKERVTAAKMKPGAPIQPRVLTTTVSAGESVTLNMTSSSAPADRIEWRKDGDVLTGADALQFRLEDVRVEDSGIYETYYVTNQTVGGGRARAEQAIMRLLVRACPVGLWGDECSMKCPTCFNGGVCHPRTGVCVCPPGFNGPICEKACGSNRYGKQCNLRCHLDFSGQTDPPDGCAHLTFCLPDPYGCSCAPGFTGLKCAEACSPGTFGAGCSLTCHCEGGVSCNRFTGVCPADCAPGYLGTNCQIVSPILLPLVAGFTVPCISG